MEEGRSSGRKRVWSTRNDADTDNGSCSGSGTGKAPRRQEEFQSQHWLQGVTLAHNLVVTPRRRWCDDDVTRIRVRSYRTAAAAAVQKTPLGGWEWRPTTYARANGRITIADRENGVHPIPDEMHPHDDVQLIDRGTVTGCHRLSQGLSQAVTGAVTGCHRDCHRGCHRLSQGLSQAVTRQQRRFVRNLLNYQLNYQL